MSRCGELVEFTRLLKDYGAETTEIQAFVVFSRFSKAFGLGNSSADFISVYMKMIDAAIDEVSAIGELSDDRKNRLKSRLNRGRKLISEANFSSWKQLKDKFFDTEYLEMLELVDDAVSSVVPDNIFDDEKIEELVEELLEIEKQILASNITVSVKFSILANLRSLIEILSNSSVWGFRDADMRMKSVVGDIVIHGDEIAKSNDASQESIMNLLKLVQKRYPGFKWSVDHLMTVTNAGLLAIQSGAI